MYWLTEDMVASWQHALMTFDLSEESLARIELPAAVLEDCADGGIRQYWIREIDGKICIATAQTYPCFQSIFGKLQIWTLDNITEQRWSQKYNIEYITDSIPCPNLVHGYMIILPRFGGNLCSYEFVGDNFNTKVGKMAKLLDYSPRNPGNIQSYVFVKSLVRLDVYKKAGIVRRPKQREGWELKTWETWEQELSNTEKSWSLIHEHEHDVTAFAQRNVKAINALLPDILDDEIRRKIDMKINQIYPNFSDQQPRPIRRLNFVAQKRDMENLLVRVDNGTSITEATRQAIKSIISMMRSALDDQVGASSSNAGTSQNHGKGDDAKT